MSSRRAGTCEDGEKRQRWKWTEKTKIEFQEAVQTLGGVDNATPKKILDNMTCKPAALTVSHVKSRLQKCRNTCGSLDGLASVMDDSDERSVQMFSADIPRENEIHTQHRRSVPLSGLDQSKRAELLEQALAHHRWLLHQLDVHTKACQEMQIQLSSHIQYIHSLIGETFKLPSIPETAEECRSLQGPTFSSALRVTPGAGHTIAFGGNTEPALADVQAEEGIAIEVHDTGLQARPEIPSMGFPEAQTAQGFEEEDKLYELFDGLSNDTIFPL